MIKAILFDMDGILYDSERFYMNGNYELLKQLGYTGSKEALKEGVGCTMEGIYALYLRLLNHRIGKEELLQEIDAYYQIHPLNYKEIMFPDIPEVVHGLYNDGYRLGCCSSSPYQVIMDSLKAMEIDSCFACVISGEQLEQSKPHPEIYLKAASVLGAEYSECVVYEDSDIGIEAGKRAGMYVIAREEHCYGQLQTQADLLVQNASEMAAWVRKENEHARNY